MTVARAVLAAAPEADVAMVIAAASTAGTGAEMGASELPVALAAQGR